MYKFCEFKDAAGKWRWSLVSGNSRIVADSGESYNTKENLQRAIAKLIKEVSKLA